MFPSSASADRTEGIAQSQFPLMARPSGAMNCGMVREDPISKAFRRLSEGAEREAATPPTGNRLRSDARWPRHLRSVGGMATGRRLRDGRGARS